MPGMMDTVLNIGLNDQTVEALARQSGNERFAWDSYRRFVPIGNRLAESGNVHFRNLRPNAVGPERNWRRARRAKSATWPRFVSRTWA